MQFNNHLPAQPHVRGRTLTITKVILDPNEADETRDTIVRVTAQGKVGVIIAILSKAKMSGDVFIKFDGDNRTEIKMESNSCVHISGFTEDKKQAEVKDEKKGENGKRGEEQSQVGTYMTLKRPRMYRGVGGIVLNAGNYGIGRMPGIGGNSGVRGIGRMW